MVGYNKQSDHEGSALESVAFLSMTVECSATINDPTMKALPLSRSLFKHDGRVVGYDKRSDHEGSTLESIASLSMTAEWSAR